MRFSQQLFIVVLLLTLAHPGKSAERPNILFIFTDDQSHRTVSCSPEAYDWVHTPNIDALAKRGVRFTHAYIGTWCMPSRATMLTGHHQFGIESMRMEGPYPGSVYDPEQCPFWPRVLRKHGYNTAQIGKWHTGIDSGFGRDWDHQIVWNRPKRPANAGNYYDEQIVEIDGKQQTISGYTTDWYTDRAIDFIRRDRGAAKKPWYMWLCYGAVHGPFTPAKRHQASYPTAKSKIPQDLFAGSRKGKPAYVRERDRWAPDEHGVPFLKSGVQQRTVKNAPIHGNTIHDWVRQYHQGVTAIDESVGRLKETLRETDQLDNTVIVFAADQGIAWGQHGFQQKVAPYDANIRGPLVVSYPKEFAVGKVCTAPVGGTDIPPTLFGLAGLPLPWKMHGHDLRPLLSDPEKAWPHPVLTTMTGECFGSDTNPIPTDPEILYKAAKVPWWISLVKDNHKYIRTLVEGEVEELYDLTSDPEELANLALDEKYRSKLLAMRQATIDELKRTGAAMADNLPEVGTR